MPELGMHFEKYKKIRLAAGISEQALKYEKKYLKLFWQHLDDHKRTEFEITEEDCKAYALHVQNMEIKQNSKLARLQAIRPFYTEALRQEWILQNPWERIKLPKREIIVPVILSVQEVKKVLEQPELHTVKGIRDRTILELLYSCALRASEVLLLEHENFCENYRTVKVIGKGNKQCVLPVGKMAAHFIKFYSEHIWPQLNKHSHKELFLSLKRKTPLNKNILSRLVQDYAKAAGITKAISSHTFRYSAATHLADLNVDIRLIQEYMRHEYANTTERYINQSFTKLSQVHKRTHPLGCKHD